MKNWIKAAGIRAVKTFAQAAVSMLSGDMLGIMEVDWLAVLSVSAMAAVVSLLTSVAGLPELKNTWHSTTITGGLPYAELQRVSAVSAHDSESEKRTHSAGGLESHG